MRFRCLPLFQIANSVRNTDKMRYDWKKLLCEMAKNIPLSRTLPTFPCVKNLFRKVISSLRYTIILHHIQTVSSLALYDRRHNIQLHHRYSARFFFLVNFTIHPPRIATYSYYAKKKKYSTRLLLTTRCFRHKYLLLTSRTKCNQSRIFISLLAYVLNSIPIDEFTKLIFLIGFLLFTTNSYLNSLSTIFQGIFIYL